MPDITFWPIFPPPPLPFPLPNARQDRALEHQRALKRRHRKEAEERAEELQRLLRLSASDEAFSASASFRSQASEGPERSPWATRGRVHSTSSAMDVVNEDPEHAEMAAMLTEEAAYVSSPEPRSRSSSNAAATRRSPQPVHDGDLLSEGLLSPVASSSMLAEASTAAAAPRMLPKHQRSASALGSLGRQTSSPVAGVASLHAEFASQGSTMRSASAGLRPRPGSTITVSSKKLQLIEDPILEMLHVLHKLMFVCEQPATLKVTPARHVLLRFKQTLFGVSATGDTDFGLAGEDMKMHLKRLSTGADVVATGVDFGPAALNVRQSIIEEKGPESQQVAARRRRHREHSAADDDDEYGDGHALTYRQLRMALEHELNELGYYGNRSADGYSSGGESGMEGDTGSGNGGGGGGGSGGGNGAAI